VTPSDVPVFVLCGGLGTRLKEETEFRPKPMVPIGEHPILLHIMRLYARHGFRRFVLCLGFKAEVIEEYFRSRPHEEWEVTLAHTGETAMTGARVARAAAAHLDGAGHFAVTYGDGLTDANLADELAFHLEHRGIGTVLGVNPPSRFGELKIDGDRVVEFDEKPQIRDHWVNGGFFLFRREFLDYLSADDGCVLEREPLVRLARDGGLVVYRHPGFWEAMDTQRDRDQLTAMLAEGRAPWLG
jgi:glucose-1-phosphate cytidylyltransferase